MTYTFAFDSNTFDKYATIQNDVQDMYANDIEESESDIFGFADAIEIDHLTDEEVETVLAMFGDFN